MIVIFLNLLYIVGSYKGLLSVLSVVLNLVIFYIGLALYFKGINLLFLCVIEMIIFSIMKKRNEDKLNKVLSYSSNGTIKNVCPNCGVNISEGTTICPKCGTQIEKE